MKNRAYKVVDVFTSEPLLGNPVAVVLECDGLETDQMQAIARWTNLSETTFVLPPTMPEADYRLRVFSPKGELPFAGHPTLGSAYGALEAGLIFPREGRVVQECGVGLVNLDFRGHGADRRTFLSLPKPTIVPISETETTKIEHIFGCALSSESSPAIVDVGPKWVVAQVDHVETLLAATPDFAMCAVLERKLGVYGITLFAKYGSDVQSGNSGALAFIEVRSFSPSGGVDEDPVCGSGNGSVAVFMTNRGIIPASGTAYVASQGYCVQRAGRVFLEVSGSGDVLVGGNCVTGLNGKLSC